MIAEIPVPLDLDAYLKRIECSGGNSAGNLRPSAETLRQVHLAHATHVPFENLDVLLGRPISLDLQTIERKIVGNHRGGYCFEQNALLAGVLERIGFPVTQLSGRVRYYTTRVLPRTHMVLKVEADGQGWLADVGFGGIALIEPIALVPDVEVRQGVWRLRLKREGDWWVLQSFYGGEWVDQYAFDLEPHLPIDYELGNFYCSSHPDSRFVQTLIVQLASSDRRVMLKNWEFIEIEAGGQRPQKVAGDEHLLELLRERFGLQFPAGTKFGFKENT